ncbi:glycoside hydrolase [Pelomyxa schiedti]|nr:glycoside hydrolase [Pelomyxa schiedti]
MRPVGLYFVISSLLLCLSYTCGQTPTQTQKTQDPTAASVDVFPLEKFLRDNRASHSKLPAPRRDVDKDLDNAHNDGDSEATATPMWGTHRPGVYLGMRSRVPGSPIVGLMWSPVGQTQRMTRQPPPHIDTLYPITKIRHQCQDSDNLIYGWTKHDGSTFGLQQIIDPDLGKAQINTTFLAADGEKNSWSLRISGSGGTGTPRALLYLYVGLPSAASSTLQLHGTKKKGIDGDAFITGNSKASGHFDLIVHEVTKGKMTHPNPSKSSADLSRFHFAGYHIDDDGWQVKDFVQNHIANSFYTQLAEKMVEKKDTEVIIPVLPNTIAQESNVIVVQCALTIPFELDVSFNKQFGTDDDDDAKTEAEIKAENALRQQTLGREISTKKVQFDARFAAAFDFKSAFSLSHINLAKAALSNLLGGMGYFFGSSTIKDLDSGTLTLGQPHPLFTAVPSRSFFPRGFLWDEGFHQLVVVPWDTEITLEVLSYWFNLMTDKGWIPREQILGSEAMSRVPPEFVAQTPSHANPPTLLLPIRALVKKVLAEKDRNMCSSDSLCQLAQILKVRDFLRTVIPFLQRQYSFFTSTQSGIVPHTFRWAGRTVNHTLASGLDDYPRASTPSNLEMHLDLLCWMILFQDTLQEISKALDLDYTAYLEEKQNLINSLQYYHFDDYTNLYYDVEAYDTATGTKAFSKHIGYITLFPLIMRLVQPDSPQLSAILNILQDPQQLWSRFGICSLSKSDPFYGTYEDYWRGPVWINMNYLVLGSLRHYAQIPGPHSERCNTLYHSLRTNLIDNIHKSFLSTGFLWEQYNAHSGEGQHSHPFTGWTSLVLLIMAENYPW